MNAATRTRRQRSIAKLLAEHQATPRYDRSGVIFWACKAGCDCEVPASTIRVAQFEAAHQADVIVRRER